MGCLFSGNRAVGNGAALVCAGGYKEHDSERFLYSNPVLVNCTFSGNRADGDGGGVCNGPGSKTRLANCVLWGNRDRGGVDESAQIDATRSDQTMIISHSCIQAWSGQLGGDGNLGLNPLLADPNGADGTMGTLDDNLMLGPDSPCRDAGDNSSLPRDTPDLDGDGDPNEPIPFDLEGRPRLENGRVDIGAYEGNSPASGGRP